MDEMKKKLEVEKLACMSECLSKWVEKEIDCGMAGADIEKLGEVVDMIKDLAQAKYYCAEAEEKEVKKRYYCVLTDKMLEEPEEEEMQMQYLNGPWGYDNYRYASSGRFAPKGRGTRYGYSSNNGGNRGNGTMSSGNMVIPIDTTTISNGGRNGNRNGSYPMGYPESRIPMNYDDPYSPYYGMENVGGPWGYHEGESHEMQYMNSEEKMRHTMDNMKEMWKNADPNLKKEMKGDMTKLLSEVPV